MQNILLYHTEVFARDKIFASLNFHCEDIIQFAHVVILKYGQVVTYQQLKKNKPLALKVAMVTFYEQWSLTKG